MVSVCICAVSEVTGIEMLHDVLEEVTVIDDVSGEMENESDGCYLYHLVHYHYDLDPCSYQECVGEVLY